MICKCSEQVNNDGSSVAICILQVGSTKSSAGVCRLEVISCKFSELVINDGKLAATAISPSPITKSFIIQWHVNHNKQSATKKNNKRRINIVDLCKAKRVKMKARGNSIGAQQFVYRS